MSDPFTAVLADAQTAIDITPVAGVAEDAGPFDGVPVMTAPILVERADTAPVHLPEIRGVSFRANMITGAGLIGLTVGLFVYGLVVLSA